MVTMAESKNAASPTLSALRQRADEELAALKATYAEREAAVRRYEAAAATIAEAEATISRAKEEQARAIAALLDAGMTVAGVAELLGVDQRRVRSVRPAADAEQRPPARPRPVAARGAQVAPAAPVPSVASHPSAGNSHPADLSVVA